MPRAKKQRTHKESKGLHGGGGRVRTLSPVSLALLGKGPIQAIKRNDTKRAKRIIEAQQAKSKDKRGEFKVTGSPTGRFITKNPEFQFTSK